MSITMITMDSIVSQNQGNIASDMDGEKVMLSIATGNYYNIGKVGGTIWDLMAQPIKVKQMIRILTGQYSVDQDQCFSDIVPFLGRLSRDGLITIR
ncbi:lasso peptide biosynthesis PqqD family chaperone [Sporolactobacillus shoreicorticis]|uniref:Lasso peptide biosynthesis PqqD family chaperone n=1 Tax=Sporolactobacillus shoreicorticis TaxID=1923877 RepID=A0ABW5S3S0_9BACL|nr:lasso peptide biosynthesis PqqD family chaperone [Sporolactobacillus shoreicorticis]MCO7124220.1 lasso peptide biosynthesis PqqD family chaperone [Sporolactobacillus shoreicorticis]